MYKNPKKLKAQSLIEIVMAIALAAFFMGMTVIGLSFTNGRQTNYLAKKNAFDILTKQKLKNEVNLGRFLSANKSIAGWTTLGAFPYQGAHQTYTGLNYYAGTTITNSVLNEEKKFFADDSPLAHWSLDGVPTSSTYIMDELARKPLNGTLTCTGTPCNNPYVISPSLGRCVHNDCLQFSGDSNGGGLVSFAANTTVDSIKRITWEAWVYPTSVSTDQMFLSKQGANYLRITGSKAFVSLSIGGSQRTLAGTTTLQNNNWYHIAASYDGAKLKLYVNGVLDNTPASYTGDLNFNTGLMYWGLWTAADRRPFNGYMDEVRIYSNALADKEVLNHYKVYREQIGLLGYWHFDDALGIADYNDITEIGSAPRFKTFSTPDNLAISTTLATPVSNELLCKDGSCLGFNSTYASKGVFSDSIDQYPLFHNPGKLTLETWIKPTSVTGVQGLITKNSSNNYKVYLNGTSVVFSLKVSGTQYTETYAAGLAIGGRYLLDFTFDGTDMKLYIDGSLKQSWNHPGTISADTSYNDIYIGWTGSGTEYFNGNMDELRIYNRALSLDEINNRYDGGYTYYQYFKPVCKVNASDTVLDSECINCVPTNGSECQTAKVHTALEPLLNKVWDTVKWGSGINYSKIDIKQIETPLLNNHAGLMATENEWSAGAGSISGGACQEFLGTGQKGEYSAPDHCTCGDGTQCCGIAFAKVWDAKVCEVSNISFFSRSGCNSCGYTGDGTPLPPGMYEQSGNKWCSVCTTNGYLRMTNAGSLTSHFISSTYAHFSPVGFFRFGFSGAINGGKVKIQYACRDSITDANGDLIPEASWSYLAPNPNHTTRCGTSYYQDMSLTPDNNKASSCWETDNLSLYNCKFFRYKLTLDSDAGGAVSPIVNWIILSAGTYVP